MTHKKSPHKIILTGGAGFIGSNVADCYLNAGFEVVVVDNLSTGKLENIPPKAKFYQADVCDFASLEKIFQMEQPNVLNHHAAQIDVRLSVLHPQKDAEINIIGLLNLLELSRKYNVAKVIYAGTGGALYGESPEKPAAENSPIQPSSPYGVSKYAGEHYLNLHGRLYGLDYTVLRYANVYGPRQNPLGEAGVIAIFIHALLHNQNPAIYGDGKQVRDYVYVEDVARANLNALKMGLQKTVNVGSGRRTSVNQLFGLLKEQMEFQGEAEYKPKRPGEIYVSSLDVELAKQVLDWKALTSLEEGLKKTVAWQKGAC